MNDETECSSKKLEKKERDIVSELAAISAMLIGSFFYEFFIFISVMFLIIVFAR